MSKTEGRFTVKLGIDQELDRSKNNYFTLLKCLNLNKFCEMFFYRKTSNEWSPQSHVIDCKM